MFGFVNNLPALTGCYAMKSKNYQSAGEGSTHNPEILSLPEEDMKDGILTRELNNTLKQVHETLCLWKIQDKVRMYKDSSDYPVFE